LRRKRQDLQAYARDHPHGPISDNKQRHRARPPVREAALAHMPQRRGDQRRRHGGEHQQPVERIR